MVPGHVLVGEKPENHVFSPKVVAAEQNGARNNLRVCLEVLTVA
jgi:hypothetical protein